MPRFVATVAVFAVSADVALVAVVAVVALPDRAALIVPAVKLPEASRFTIALAVLALVAVVHVGATLPPALVRTSPDEPADAVNCVLPMPNCHGIAPCVPPCKLVALVALVAVSAVP